MREIERRWLNVRELAQYLGTTPKAIYGLTERGVIPRAKLGGRLKFDRRKIDRLLEKSEVRPAEL